MSTARTGSAQEAWEDGFQILAWRLNAVIADKATGVQIKAPPPRQGVTLKKAAHRLSNALLGIRPKYPDLPRDGEIKAWILGYPNGLDDRPDSVTLCINEDHIDHTLKFLAGGRLNWTAKDWQELIIEPVEKHAVQCRQFFEQVEGNDSAPEEGKNKKWYHEADEKPPDRFRNGPMTDTQNNLGLYLGSKQKTNSRVLKQKSDNGEVWVRKSNGRGFEAFFHREKAYNAAHFKKLEIEQQKDTEKTQKRHKGQVKDMTFE